MIESSYSGEHILSTVLVRYPRMVHSEMLRHRVFSSSVSSSRAKPLNRWLEEDIAMPAGWHLNQPGMQGGDDYEDEDKAKEVWLEASKSAKQYATTLHEMGLHKQVVNRVIEPFTHVDHLISSTEWDNFFRLRLHKDADPTIQEVAKAIYEVLNDEYAGDLLTRDHLPFITKQEMRSHEVSTLRMVSGARCARVSYSNHDGTNPSIINDLKLADKLIESNHWSPFEHQGMALTSKLITHTDRYGYDWSNNFKGIGQYRVLLDDI